MACVTPTILPSFSRLIWWMLTIWPLRRTLLNGPASETMLSPATEMTRTSTFWLFGSFSFHPVIVLVAVNSDVVRTVSRSIGIDLDVHVPATSLSEIGGGGGGGAGVAAAVSAAG